jgi:hypothetical protein
MNEMVSICGMLADRSPSSSEAEDYGGRGGNEVPASAIERDACYKVSVISASDCLSILIFVGTQDELPTTFLRTTRRNTRSTSSLRMVLVDSTLENPSPSGGRRLPIIRAVTGLASIGFVAVALI